MKKLVAISLLLVSVLLGSETVKAQAFNDFFKKKDVLNRKPIELPAVREADIIWAKQIWRIVDLREKTNHSLYFPTKELDGRTNLINLLLEGIKDGVLTAYDAREDEEFKTPITYEQVREMFGATTTTRRVRDFDTGELVDKKVEGKIRPEEVKQLMIKEVWYFNKQSSALEVRIQGICPIRVFYRNDAIAQDIAQRQQVFWISYPEARELLAKKEVYNPYNDAISLSFDDLFIKRKFNSYIVAESNAFNNRMINSYLSGTEAMMESKRIEDKMFNFEQDLWEY
ncbi:gliding motility protein GldN [Puteibacter caeruleilacunae]|nr:gliding motility protein GldN [Puteibacter caeruleilacunae]